MILLTSGEMQTIRNQVTRYVALDSSIGRQAVSEDTAKAQLKKVVEWLRENRAITVDDLRLEYNVFGIDNDAWEALLKEIE